MKQFRKLLWPLSWLYNGITFLRNQAFNKDLLKKQTYAIPIINVGNLSTGGTGKSPFVAYISDLFNKRDIAVLSRGYGRSTKGLFEVETNSQASTIGDEPAQLKSLYPDLRIVVAEDRRAGMDYLLKKKNPPKLVVLDDAYQHRYVQASFNLLLTTCGDPFFNDLVLPAGDLRENRLGAHRAHAVVVTKCPEDFSEKAAMHYRKRIKPYTKAPVFFAGLQYEKAKNLNSDILSDAEKVNLLTGIANPKQLLTYVQERFTLHRHLSFPDHHNFSNKEIKEISKLLEQDRAPLITTRKDFHRLKELLSSELSKRIYVQDIKPFIKFDEADIFDKLIKEQLS